MRNLTKQQKKLIKQWFDKNYKGDSIFNMADKIDSDTYNKIEQLNPTEILYQNINNFCEELANQEK